MLLILNELLHLILSGTLDELRGFDVLKVSSKWSNDLSVSFFKLGPSKAVFQWEVPYAFTSNDSSVGMLALNELRDLLQVVFMNSAVWSVSFQVLSL